jgi:hypothetical protein
MIAFMVLALLVVFWGWEHHRRADSPLAGSTDVQDRDAE